MFTLISCPRSYSRGIRVCCHSLAAAWSDATWAPTVRRRCMSTVVAQVASTGSIGTAHNGPYAQRTHTCGELSAADVGTRVVLAGWLQAERKVSKKMSFFPLKDSFGATQLLVLRGKDATNTLTSLSETSVESIVLIEGEVCLRPEKDRRPDSTGQIEVKVERLTVLNPADRDLPFNPSDAQNLANEDLRARYRYLDLRRPALSENLKKRSQVARLIRDVLYEEDFIEVETPLLLKSTPEGAREFLVPTRTPESNKLDLSGHEKVPLFYALPQSPQQPKQLLICSGAVDRYFQIAKCFRDEDGRKDRQPEFTQVDLEVAFPSWGESHVVGDGWNIGGREIRDVIEAVMRKIWTVVEGVTLPERFRVMTYREVMSRFGSDKPDMRLGLEIHQITHLLPAPVRAIFEKSKQAVECLIIRRGQDSAFLSASEIIQRGNNAELNGNECIIITEENVASWFATSRTLSDVAEIREQDTVINTECLNLTAGDVVWVTRRPDRLETGRFHESGTFAYATASDYTAGDYTPTRIPHFLWVTEFPLFTRADDEKEFLARGRWSSSHHPFTAPMWQDVDAMYSGEIEKVRGQHYDLVLNGVEIGGGSVRVHDAAMQNFIFSNILQLSEAEKASFHHLTHALRCGAPPHGGIALGFDRLMAILCKTQSIRDVIAFPKTSAGTDLLFQSPAAVVSSVLHQYGIQPRVT